MEDAKTMTQKHIKNVTDTLLPSAPFLW